MLKFPHISLLRNVIAYIEHVNTDPEVPAQYRVDSPVTFRGTVKLHGANCGVIWTPHSGLQAQSRETLLYPNKVKPKGDYKGFALFAEEYSTDIQVITDSILPEIEGKIRALTLYGEWVGAGVASKNKGSAVSKFDPKHWALFAVSAQVDDDAGHVEIRDVSHTLFGVQSPTTEIGNIHTDCAGWTVTIDFSDPASVEAGRAEVQRLTDEVAAQCPYGEAYNLTGAGEGIVWMPTGEYHGREDLYWKHKSAAHSVVDLKVKKERPVVADDVLAAINAFIEMTVTDNRLDQGIDALDQQGLGAEKRNTGKFVRWVTDDVERECVLELADAGLTWEQVSNAVTTKARVFFLANAK